MEVINKVRIPKGVDRIAVKQHDDKIVIEFMPEEPEFKRGDILKSTITHALTVIFDKITSPTSFDSIYNDGESSNHGWSLKSFRHATKEEKQEFFDELKADGKWWNAEKLEIEDMPQPKFKVGDKVTLKSGCTSNSNLAYISHLDEYIGKELIVIDYTERGNVRCNNSFCFAEDWLEPYVEELKKGDLAIFWDGITDYALIRIYGRGCHEYHYDSCGTGWKNAIKFESKEQFEKVLRGEI